jgi:hypothetical protein
VKMVASPLAIHQVRHRSTRADPQRSVSHRPSGISHTCSNTTRSTGQWTGTRRSSSPARCAGWRSRW